MIVTQFIKGSVWEFTEATRIYKRDVPAGTRFSIPYPRRRESNTVIIKFIDFAGIPRRLGHRFPKADLALNEDALQNTRLVEKPNPSTEYYIRKIDTGKLWGGGQESPMQFAYDDFDRANHYATIDTAITGIASIAFKTGRNPPPMNTECPWEIVIYDPFEGRAMSTFTIPQGWWSACVGCARIKRRHDGKKSIHGMPRSPLERMARAVVNGLSIHDQRTWVALAYDKGDEDGFTTKTFPKDELEHAGISYLLGNEGAMLLHSDQDRVMLTLLFPNRFEVHPFEVEHDVLS